MSEETQQLFLVTSNRKCVHGLEIENSLIQLNSFQSINRHYLLHYLFRAVSEFIEVFRSWGDRAELLKELEKTKTATVVGILS